MRMLVVGVVLAAGGAASAGPILDAIDVVEDPAAVRLHLSAPVGAQTRTLAAEGPAPERIYLDLPDTALAGAVPRLMPGSGPLLLRVRAGPFDVTTTRVVLDLAEDVPFSVEQTDRTITITLRPSPAPPPVAAPIPPRPTPLAAAPATPPAPERTTPAPSEASPRTAHPPTDLPTAPAPLRRPAPPPRVAALPEHPLIVLDAGHGGRDPGAEGVGGVIEKDVVLELARVVARRLAARLPVDVLMTRVDDSYVPIQRRLAVPGEGATLFISLHANSCSDSSARGLEIFYGGGTVRRATSDGSDSRAALLGRCLDDALQARIGGVRGAPRPGSFGVLVRNPVPSALVEIGYLTHPGEAARTQDSDYQELLADALTDGVAAFLRASAPRL